MLDTVTDTPPRRTRGTETVTTTSPDTAGTVAVPEPRAAHPAGVVIATRARTIARIDRAAAGNAVLPAHPYPIYEQVTNGLWKFRHPSRTPDGSRFAFGVLCVLFWFLVFLGTVLWIAYFPFWLAAHVIQSLWPPTRLLAAAVVGAGVFYALTRYTQQPTPMKIAASVLAAALIALVMVFVESRSTGQDG